MGKNKGFDAVAEAHERANHNFNPYYWFNRVSSYQMADWRITRMLSPIFFVLYSWIGYLAFNKIEPLAMEQNKSFIAYLLDFSDSFTSARAVGMFMFLFFWIVLGIGTVQNVLRVIYAPPISKPILRKEKKKRHPKRPKNYK